MIPPTIRLYDCAGRTAREHWWTTQEFVLVDFITQWFSMLIYSSTALTDRNCLLTPSLPICSLFLMPRETLIKTISAGSTCFLLYIHRHNTHDPHPCAILDLVTVLHKRCFTSFLMFLPKFRCISPFNFPYFVMFSSKSIFLPPFHFLQPKYMNADTRSVTSPSVITFTLLWLRGYIAAAFAFCSKFS